jgi:hypothetical protein
MSLTQNSPSISTNEGAPERRISDGKYGVETQRLLPGTQRYEAFLAARYDYMKDRGWITGELSDEDVYDLNFETIQLGAYTPDGKLVNGMRLTPIEHYQQSMSWEMIAHTPIADQVEATGIFDHEQPIWDLTRLVAGEARGRASFEAIPKLFGQGLRECQRRGDEDPLWIFLLDEAMERWLQRQQVAVTQLGRARINGDAHESVFGYVEPAQVAALRKTHAFAYRAMGED